MPHDVKGRELKVGDEVLVRGKIAQISSDPANAQYCNCTVELNEPMPAYPDQKSTFSGINAKQVEKVGA